MDEVLNGLKKAALITLGTVSVIMGIVGVILPLIPGTPFFILAGYCFNLAFQE
jgi:uncharacterized membrane protein YbaN (DUF454 family)